METVPPAKVVLLVAFLVAFMFIVFKGLYTLRLHRRQRKLAAEKARLRREFEACCRDSGHSDGTGGVRDCSWCFITNGGKCRWCREAEDPTTSDPAGDDARKDPPAEGFASQTRPQMEGNFRSPDSTMFGSSSGEPHPSPPARSRRHNNSASSGSRNGGPKVITGISIMNPGSQPPSPELFLGSRGNVIRKGSLRSLKSADGNIHVEFAMDATGKGEGVMYGGVDGKEGTGVNEDDMPKVVVKHSFKAGRGLYEHAIVQTEE